MRLRIAIPEEHVTPEILNAGLYVNQLVNEQLRKSKQTPSFTDAVKAGAVHWSPEPPGEERFDHSGMVLGRGWGDCDDLAPWRAADLRTSGEDPGARSKVIQTGPKLWHAIVERSDGSLEDPSQAAGMRAPQGVNGAVTRPLLRNGRPAFAVRSAYGAWHARTDLPWIGSRLGTCVVGYGHGADPLSALSDSVRGACLVGQCSPGTLDPVQCNHLLAIDAHLHGASPRQIAKTYQVDPSLTHAVVGQMLGALNDGSGEPLLVRF